MKLRKKLCTGIMLVSALILSGCGGDDDSSDSTANNGGNNSEGSSGAIVDGQLKFTVFDYFNDIVDGDFAAGRGKLVYNLSSSNVSPVVSTIVGSSSTAYQNISINDDDIDYYVSNNIFLEIPIPDDFDNRYFKVRFTDNDTFKLTVQRNNSAIVSTYDIITLNISGLGRVSNNATKGIVTDLETESDYLPDNISFPTGSQCYIFRETPDQSYYDFYDSDEELGSNITIDQWIADQNFSGNTVSNLVRENVGRNNELRAVRYTDSDGDIVAAVQFNGLVYDANYYSKGVPLENNFDPTTEIVECDQYNDTAANFLEEQFIIQSKKL